MREIIKRTLQLEKSDLKKMRLALLRADDSLMLMLSPENCTTKRVMEVRAIIDSCVRVLEKTTL